MSSSRTETRPVKGRMSSTRAYGQYTNLQGRLRSLALAGTQPIPRGRTPDNNLHPLRVAYLVAFFAPDGIWHELDDRVGLGAHTPISL